MPETVDHTANIELPSDAPHVVIYTDGACKGNPGRGGWGAWLRGGGHERDLFGGEPVTTNNRMELTAVIAALNALKQPSRVDLHTDSTYVRSGIMQWIHNWKKRGWRTSANKPVANEDLWRALDDATQRHDLTWHWVKGHSGDEGNEHADMLANKGAAAQI